ncbi:MULTISPECIES: hypothetical protein [unclassified Paenibacillus]|uniref:hypothetical protein n=1 Tax=unclassified Paenibacillus TaxID=185978 RepID=UPI00277F459D|nr:MULTISPECIES: hypothetical protein [unclassified Paenibacillus]MDQ0903555.1 hypothetical protein [Paenibacillus sp. V4I7]MDQ0917967.1 hypothetical protein [Paenibacillus sp. V4I5]
MVSEVEVGVDGEDGKTAGACARRFFAFGELLEEQCSYGGRPGLGGGDVFHR